MTAYEPPATADDDRSDDGFDCIAGIDVSTDGLFFADTVAAYDGFSGILSPYQVDDGIFHSLLRTDSVEYGVLKNRARVDSTVRSVNYLRTVNGDHLYNLELRFGSKSPLRRLDPDEFQLFDARGTSERWRVLLWLSSIEPLDACRRTAEREGIDWEIRDVYWKGSHDPLDELTPVQRETVEAAFELGYFDIPRTVSMKELAAELDVTPNAVSERLRRAERRMFSALLST